MTSFTSEPCPLELLLKIAKRKPKRCRPAVRAVAAAVDQLAAGEQGFDLAGGERVARFHRGFAGHHVEHFVQQLFIVQVEQLLLAALEQFRDEPSRLETVEE